MDIIPVVTGSPVMGKMPSPILYAQTLRMVCRQNRFFRLYPEARATRVMAETESVDGSILCYGVTLRVENSQGATVE